jgi:hydroxymethylglutaryl-CoA lyase
MPDYPKSVHLVEVGPRDGLQIEQKILSTADKVRLIEAIADAGIREIEVGSFVNPKAVPQMADTEEVFSALKPRDGVRYRGLWLNLRGLERALETKNIAIDGVIHLTASEIFVKRNTNRSIDETFEQVPQWIERFQEAGIKPDSVGVMAAFGCNFEGDVPVARVIDMLARLEDMLVAHGSELNHISLADTMGWANPRRMKEMIGAVRTRWPEVGLGLHLHDTRGTAMANALAALEEGVREFDGSIGGLGGCPFAGHRGAAGNICTEDLAFLCEEMGIETGIDLDALVETARLAESLLGHPLPGKVMKGGTRTSLTRPAS